MLFLISLISNLFITIHKRIFGYHKIYFWISGNQEEFDKVIIIGTDLISRYKIKLISSYKKITLFLVVPKSIEGYPKTGKCLCRRHT